MISGVDLLNRYKEEKTMVIGAEDVRTGLEDFPSFKEWKAEYIREYNETHVTVDIKEADAMFDALVDEAEEELEGVSFDGEPAPLAEPDDEVPAEQAEPAEEPPAEPEPKAAKKSVRSLKPPLKPKAKPRTKPAYKSRSKSKMQKAEAIFSRWHEQPGWTRKRIIEKFCKELDMTQAGASTYYQKLKKATS